MLDFYKSFGLHPGCKPENFIEGRILLIDKPTGWSSFDIVNKVRILIRQHFGFNKIKVGHAGTLDPLATGLLILCTGKLTKQIEELTGMDKEYLASITLGSTTPSYDLETGVDYHFETSHIEVPLIEEILKGFIGKQMQTPPLFSAIQVNGKRAYEHARQGSDMVLEQREVEFKELELTSYNKPVAVVRVKCSKGTYVRSFANDFGKALKSGGHLSGLVRTSIGPFKNADAQTIEQLNNYFLQIRAK